MSKLLPTLVPNSKTDFTLIFFLKIKKVYSFEPNLENYNTFKDIIYLEKKYYHYFHLKRLTLETLSALNFMMEKLLQRY